jgi:hypothetical protein
LRAADGSLLQARAPFARRDGLRLAGMVNNKQRAGMGLGPRHVHMSGIKQIPQGLKIAVAVATRQARFSPVLNALRVVHAQLLGRLHFPDLSVEAEQLEYCGTKFFPDEYAFAL